MGLTDGQVALPLRRDGQELVPGFAVSPGFLNEEVGADEGAAENAGPYAFFLTPTRGYAESDLVGELVVALSDYPVTTSTLIDDFVLDGPETFYVDPMASR